MSRLQDWCFLTSLCHDEHEPYYPADGDGYSDCGYFRRSSLREARGFWRRTAGLIRAGKAPRELGLYLHWPFCPAQCAFCFCSMAVPRSAGEMKAYAALLEREMEAFRGPLEGVPFTSVYLGGGTPTFIPDALLDRLLGRLRSSFTLAPDAEVYVEASPATLTRAKLGVLRRHGVNRLTLGVQSLDPKVLSLGRRPGQTRATVARAVRLAREAPEVYSGVELMFGLEGQTPRSFIRDVVEVMKLGPDAVYLYGFDARPRTPFARAGKRLPPRVREAQLRMPGLLDKVARLHGYRPPSHHPDTPEYMSTISRQCRAARRCGASILGLGAGALSHAFGSAWYRHPPIEESPRGWRGLPPFFSLESPPAEEMRGYAVRHLYTQGELSREGFRGLFGRDPMEVPALAKPLRSLAALGKLRVAPGLIAFTTQDRAQRVVYSKSLYSPGLERRLLAAHRAEHREFLRGNPESALKDLGPAADRRVAALMTTFERPRQ
jgi:oxygen-independent coproporphyrinogen-3 oxidase